MFPSSEGSSPIESPACAIAKTVPWCLRVSPCSAVLTRGRPLLPRPRIQEEQKDLTRPSPRRNSQLERLIQAKMVRRPGSLEIAPRGMISRRVTARQGGKTHEKELMGSRHMARSREPLPHGDGKAPGMVQGDVGPGSHGIAPHGTISCLPGFAVVLHSKKREQHAKVMWGLDRVRNIDTYQALMSLGHAFKCTEKWNKGQVENSASSRACAIAPRGAIACTLRASMPQLENRKKGPGGARCAQIYGKRRCCRGLVTRKLKPGLFLLAFGGLFSAERTDMQWLCKSMHRHPPR
eukprot:Gb_00563 [translate_table: standard]